MSDHYLLTRDDRLDLVIGRYVRAFSQLEHDIANQCQEIFSVMHRTARSPEIAAALQHMILSLSGTTPGEYCQEYDDRRLKSSNEVLSYLPTRPRLDRSVEANILWWKKYARLAIDEGEDKRKFDLLINNLKREINLRNGLIHGQNWSLIKQDGDEFVNISTPRAVQEAWSSIHKEWEKERVLALAQASPNLVKKRSPLKAARVRWRQVILQNVSFKEVQTMWERATEYETQIKGYTRRLDGWIPKFLRDKVSPDAGAWRSAR